MRNLVLAALSVGLLSACEEEAAEAPEPLIRGLKTHLVQDVEQTTTRRYPSLLQPAEISTLSFEVGGRLEEIALSVGQRVEAGQVLASLDPAALQLQVEASEAGLAQLEAEAKNAKEQAERSAELLERGVVTKADADKDATDALTAAAAVVQAKRNLDQAVDNLDNATLSAPFTGILNSVEVDSFTTVSAGAPVATLYATDAFEVSFSVSFEVVNRLAVGKPVKIRLADTPDITLTGHVSELGARADTVSSFPVVARLDETHPSIKAGMAVELSMEFTVPSGSGFPLPLTVLPMTGQVDEEAGPEDPSDVEIFVFDPETSTVKSRMITIGGVRENALIAIQGVEVGDRVASAGASFLRDGMKVKLLPDAN
ncbi:MAG: efflux RND transporter periplasmic adaptor subunit [Pseudomonadota bacterium]